MGTLTARKVMLEQLAAEIMKMKRLLLEAQMAISGDKQVVAELPTPQLRSSAPDSVPQFDVRTDKNNSESKQSLISEAMPPNVLETKQVAPSPTQPLLNQKSVPSTTSTASLFEKARSGSLY
jgi:hypothetical protein